MRTMACAGVTSNICLLGIGGCARRRAMKVLCALRLLLLLADRIGWSLSQVQITEPAALAQSFQSRFPPDGIIPGSTATFGAPLYGENLSGRFLYRASTSRHCKGDYISPSDVPSQDAPGDVPFNNMIFVVDRGNCSFVQKARLAQDLGALAVVVADDEEDSTPASLSRLVIADDGHGAGKIVIPTILIDYHSGREIKTQASSAALGDPEDPKHVYGDLTWVVAAGSTAELDFWYSASSEEGMNFLIGMGPFAEVFKAQMTIRTHPHLEELPKLYQELCYDPTGNGATTYCEEDPDGPMGPVEGRDVVLEEVRQHCVWETTKKMYGDTQQSEYSKEFFSYITLFNLDCSVAAHNARQWNKAHNRPVDESFPPPFSSECSKYLLKSIGMNENALDQCISSESTQQWLAVEGRSQSYGPVALRINGQRFGGDLDPELVIRAVCSSLEDRPQACNDLSGARLLKTSAPSKGEDGGMPWWGVCLIIVLCSTLVGGGFFLYRKQIEKNIRNNLRMEVMMEVRSQMEDYRRLPEES